jgi:hypothetical protein
MESGTARRTRFTSTYVSHDLLEMDALACNTDKIYLLNLFQKIIWH